MSIGTVRTGLSGPSNAGGGVAATPTPGSGSAVIAIGSPATGVLQNWDLYVREQGAAEWDEVATGITASSQSISNLDAETAYQYRVVPHVLVDGETLGQFTTGALPAIPLVPWTQIEGGMQFGSAFTGGEQWWWDDAVDGTFYADFTNQEADSIIAAKAIIEGAGTVAPMTGWGIQSAGSWDVDGADYQPPAGGSVASPNIVESAELALTTPIPGGGSAQYQELRAPGAIVPATSLSGNCFPGTGIVSAENFLEGAYLGSNPGGGFPGLGPAASRIYLKKSGDPLYIFGVIGDSTTVPVQPLDSATPLSREGYHFRANQALRSAGKRVRIYSYGQGAAGWSDILARGRALLPHVVGKISRLVVQVWTWNTGWSTEEQADAAWLEYLDFEAEVLEAGIGCSPMILHPYTTRNDPGQVLAFGVLKGHAMTHPYGIVLDEIMGDSDWPNLPSAESQDNVHQNGVGASRVGPLIAPVFLSVAAATYPELA